MTKPKSTKPAQLKIAGTERPDRIGAIDALAEEYRSTRDARMAYGEEELELKAKLLKLMREHGRERYVYEDDQGNLEEVVLIAEEVTVKVRKVKPDRPAKEAS